MTMQGWRIEVPGRRLGLVLAVAVAVVVAYGWSVPGAAWAAAAGASEAGGATAASPAAADAGSATGAAAPGAPATLVDINRASEKELASLPGVGPATARKIVAGRPYGSVEELARAGVPARTLHRIAPLVTAGRGSGPALRGAAGPGTAHTPAQRAALSVPPPAPRVDLNRAGEKDLETLPGVGPAAARKIIAARPYSTVEDLARAGLPASVIAKLAPYATAGPAAAPPTPASAPVAGSGVPATAGPPPW